MNTTFEKISWWFPVIVVLLVTLDFIFHIADSERFLRLCGVLSVTYSAMAFMGMREILRQIKGG